MKGAAGKGCQGVRRPDDLAPLTSWLRSGRPGSLGSDSKASPAFLPQIWRKMMLILPHRERVKQAGSEGFTEMPLCEEVRASEPLLLLNAPSTEYGWKKLFLHASYKNQPILLLTLVPLVLVLAVSGCFSLGTWPLDNDVTGVFRSTQECWKYTERRPPQYMVTGVFANSPPSLQAGTSTAPCDTPLTVDICCLNAQVLRDSTDEGETV